MSDLSETRLLPLALAAVDDPAARLVLLDALEESGWSSDRAHGAAVHRQMYQLPNEYYDAWDRGPGWSIVTDQLGWFRVGLTGLREERTMRRFAEAIVSVLRQIGEEPRRGEELRG
ncbi:MAG: hypothetical protein KF782_34755 [Labilithrix sp.]|nr:hypothetical protein [Labilithrix sp.]